MFSDNEAEYSHSLNSKLIITYARFYLEIIVINKNDKVKNIGLNNQNEC